MMEVKKVNITRPDNTTPYSVNDVLSGTIADIKELVTVARKSSLKDFTIINIVGANIKSNASQSLLPLIDLWILKTEPTAIDDNDSLTLTDDEIKEVVGIVPITEWFYSDNNCIGIKDSINIPVRLDEEETGLFIIPVFKNAYIPISEEEFEIQMYFERNN